MLARIEARQEFLARVEARRLDLRTGIVRARIPDARLEHAAQTGDAKSGNLDHLAADIALGKIRDQVIEHGVGLGVLVAEYPVYAPAHGEQRRQHMAQRHTQLAIAEQDQRARLLCGACAQDRREIAVRVAGDDNGRRHAGYLDYVARPNPSRRAAGPIVQPWMISDTTTTTNTALNNLSSRIGSANAGMKLI